MLPLSIQTPVEIARVLARRVRERRLERMWTQQETADRAGITLSTYRLFERTGKISLERFLRLVIVLDAASDLDELFAAPQARSLDQLEQRGGLALRKRGRRRDAAT